MPLSGNTHGPTHPLAKPNDHETHQRPVAVSVFLSIRHGWAGVTQTLKPAEAQLLAGLGFTKPTLYVFSLYTLAVARLLLFPKTFFLGNLLNAAGFLLMLSLALHTGNLRLAATELAILMIPLALIWLRHPLAN